MLSNTTISKCIHFNFTAKLVCEENTIQSLREEHLSDLSFGMLCLISTVMFKLKQLQKLDFEFEGIIVWLMVY